MAVCVELPMAVKVIVVVAAIVWWKVPTIVPLVKGVVRVNGESTPSVFVIEALAGVAEYVAEQVGLVIVAPISRAPPQPVNELIVKGVAMLIVTVFVVVTQESPVPHAIVIAGPV